MNSVDPLPKGNSDEGFPIQIGFGQGSVPQTDGSVSEVNMGRAIVRFRVNHDALQAPGPQGAEDSDGNGAAIGNEHALNHGEGSALGVPEQKLHGGGVKAAAGIVQLRAVGDQDEHIHVRHHLYVLARAGNAVGEAQAPVRG